MASAKDIFIKPINSRTANEFIKRTHYSGKVVPNSQLHLGVFLGGVLGGVLQFGPSMMKKNIITIIEDTEWNEFLELNRMAFNDILPRCSESRAIGISIRLIRKNYPHIKWIISFSDGTQCGDGTIYRASGFKLTKINSVSPTRIMPDGTKITRMTITKGHHLFKNKGKASWPEGSIPLEGFQLRYIYFIDKSCIEKLTVPILPFSDIDKMGAGMYKGKKISIADRRVKQAISGDQLESGGAAPTHTLQKEKTA